MRISNEPQQTEVPHLSGNTRVNVWVALLVMDDEQDTSLTTGWYWRLADMGAAENERHDLEAWRKAALNEQGPYRNADNAMQGVAYYSVERATLAGRLNEANELMRMGQLDATIEQISEWLSKADEMDRALRNESRAPQTQPANDDGQPV